MAYLLIIVVMAVLLIRPAEAFPALSAIQFYQITIVPCLILALGPLVQQVTGPSLKQRPISALLMGFIVLAVVTNLIHGQIDAAIDLGSELVKVFLFYLLVNAIVDRPARFSSFVMATTGMLSLTALLAVLNYHGVITPGGFRVIQEGAFRRMGGPVSIGDPNDFCTILVVALIYGLYGLTHRRLGPARFLWLAPLGLFGYAIQLTQSRGGLLAALTGIVVLLWCWFGWRRALALAALGIPVLLAQLGTRQASLSTSEGTGQARLQLWQMGLTCFLHSPVLGQSQGWETATLGGHSLHNSYLQAFVETGVVGGLMFLGCFYYVLNVLSRPEAAWGPQLDPELRRTRPYVLAATAAYSVGIFTLNHCYTFPTFLILAIAMSFIRLADPYARLPRSVLDGQLVSRVAVAGLAFVACIYVMVKTQVRW